MPVEYAVKHRGCAIICGAAPSLFEDLEAARKLRPDAATLGVKYVAAIVPEIEHVWTQHGEMSIKIKDSVDRPIKIHARPKILQTPKGTLWHIPYARESFDAIDYVWPGLSFAVGSSGVAGAMWARHGMGFEEVIMAGITLSVEDQKYAQGYPNKYSQHAGYARADQIDNWFRVLKRHQEEGLTMGIYSMSGRTKDLLGAPE